MVLAQTLSEGVATLVSEISEVGSAFCRKVSVPPFFGVCARAPHARASADYPASVARRVVRNFAVMSGSPSTVRKVSLTPGQRTRSKM